MPLLERTKPHRRQSPVHRRTATRDVLALAPTGKPAARPVACPVPEHSAAAWCSCSQQTRLASTGKSPGPLRRSLGRCYPPGGQRPAKIRTPSGRCVSPSLRFDGRLRASPISRTPFFDAIRCQPAKKSSPVQLAGRNLWHTVLLNRDVDHGKPTSNEAGQIGRTHATP